MRGRGPGDEGSDEGRRRLSRLWRQRLDWNLRQGIRRFHARANAVGYADAVISVAGERQPGNFRYALLNALHPRDVSRLVLRHGSAPAVHAREDRLCIQLQEVFELAVHRVEYLVIGEAE